MSNRRPLLYLAFGLPIAGALAGSYLHLAAWLRPWMPAGWEWLSWVSALSMDGLIFAPVIARQIVGANVPGMSLRAAQGMGIVSSVYVNARWGWDTMPTDTLGQRVDIFAGAAILPVLVLVAELGMRASLSALQGQSTGTQEADIGQDIPAVEIQETPAEQGVSGAATTDTARDTAVGTRRSRANIGPSAADTGRGQKRRTLAEGADIWRSFVDRGVTEPADIAAAVGVGQKTVRRWRAAAG